MILLTGIACVYLAIMGVLFGFGGASGEESTNSLRFWDLYTGKWAWGILSGRKTDQKKVD